MLELGLGLGQPYGTSPDRGLASRSSRSRIGRRARSFKVQPRGVTPGIGSPTAVGSDGRQAKPGRNPSRITRSSRKEHITLRNRGKFVDGNRTDGPVLVEDGDGKVSDGGGTESHDDEDMDEDIPISMIRPTPTSPQLTESKAGSATEQRSPTLTALNDDGSGNVA